MKKLYLYSLLIFTGFEGIAQHNENANWVFGTKNRLSFNTGIPSASTIPTSTPFSVGEGTASVSDRLGRLLSYTDGVRVFNGNNVQIGTGLLGNVSSSQNAIYIRKPNNQMRFYVATISGITGDARSNKKGLHYSEVDMETSTQGVVLGKLNVVLNDHLGVPIGPSYSNHSEGITSAMHSDPDKYWLIAHISSPDASNGGLIKEYIYSYLVTKDSIDPNPARSAFIPNHSVAHYIKVSPNGERIAIGTNFSGVYLGSFNKTTGEVIINSTIRETENLYFSNGVEFSPNSNVLYYSGRAASTGAGTLTRLNLITSTKITESHPSFPFALQRAINNKIYLCVTSDAYVTNELAVISDPDNTTNTYIVDQSQTMLNNIELGLPQWIWKQSCESTLFDNEDIPLNFQTVEEQRRDSIFATNRVNVGARLIYHSGGFIELLPNVNPLDSTDIGFEAEFGSQFVAEIADCDTAFTYKNGQTANQPSDETKDFIALNKIKIFPNPSNASVTVSYNEALKSIRILSMDGKTIFTRNTNENESQIDVSNFVDGIYLITVETQNGKFLQTKFIKN